MKLSVTPVNFFPRETSTPKSNSLNSQSTDSNVDVIPSITKPLVGEGENRLIVMDAGERKDKAASFYENVNNQQQNNNNSLAGNEEKASPPQVAICQLKNGEKEKPLETTTDCNETKNQKVWYEYGCV